MQDLQGSVAPGFFLPLKFTIQWMRRARSVWVVVVRYIWMSLVSIVALPAGLNQVFKIRRLYGIYSCCKQNLKSYGLDDRKR